MSPDIDLAAFVAYLVAAFAAGWLGGFTVSWIRRISQAA